MVSENKDLNLSVMLNAFSKLARLVNIAWELCILPVSLNVFDLNSSSSDTKWLEWFEQKFSSLSGSSQEIDFDDFKKALHIKEVYIWLSIVPLTFCYLTSDSLSLIRDSHSLQNDSFKFLTKIKITVSVCMSSERVCLY